MTTKLNQFNDTVAKNVEARHEAFEHLQQQELSYSHMIWLGSGNLQLVYQTDDPPAFKNLKSDYGRLLGLNDGFADPKISFKIESGQKIIEINTDGMTPSHFSKESDEKNGEKSGKIIGKHTYAQRSKTAEMMEISHSGAQR